MVSLVVLAVVLFASTNIDDAFVLLGFLADPTFRGRDVVIGQYVGIAVLFGASVVASLVSLVVPEVYVGLLGLAPIYIGGKKLHAITRGRKSTEEDLRRHPDAWPATGAFTVAIVTIANGGDNIAVYTPLFATKSSYELALIGAVFAVMTAAWCVVANWMVKHPTLGVPIRRYGHAIVPLC